MSEEQLSKKRLWFVVIVAYFIFGYLSCSYFNMHRSSYFDVSLPFESYIPFVPFFITGYTSVYFGLILVYAVIDDYAYFKRAMKFFIAATTVHFILFLLIPVKMSRPDLAKTDGVMNTFTYYYYLIDNPVNCFPSLHVSFPLSGTFVLWNYKRKWGYLLLAMTLFIAVSVVLVKQHYIMDVVGAFFTTGLIYCILKRRA